MPTAVQVGKEEGLHPLTLLRGLGFGQCAYCLVAGHGRSIHKRARRVVSPTLSCARRPLLAVSKTRRATAL